ncbi:hydrolase [Spirochaetia bacterium]|nr:hydrolase [Spirochaetia bacterium]
MVEAQAEERRIPMDDGTQLFVRRWRPVEDGKPRAVLHIVHGMAEHGLRYGRLAQKLRGAGIEVWAADQRGHGKTADLSVNDPGKGGLLGHCADRDGCTRVTADIEALNRIIKKEWPGVPLFLLGHSWGSFIAQNYLENFGHIDGCILSGSRGPDGLKVSLGAPFMALLALLRGSRNASLLSRSMADGSYNKPFKPNRTASDWLSRDEAEVDAFIADPFSGTLCSAGFYRDMIALLNRIHRPQFFEGIQRNLPVYIFSGSEDPVGEMGASPTALAEAYRALGMKDLEFVLYPGARHEALNETNREEVMENLLAWIVRHIPPD